MNISEISSHIAQPKQDSTDVSYQVMPQEGNLDPIQTQSPAPQPVKTPALPPPPTPIPTEGAPQEYKPSFLHSTLFKIIVGVVLLAALGAGAFFMLKNKKTTTPEPATQTSKLPKVWLQQYFNKETCDDQPICGDESDSDKDGFKNYDEFKAGTSPVNPDTDGDGLADGDEANIYKTEPTLKFTDRRDIVAKNGWSDGVQIKAGFDPLTPGLQLTDARIRQIADDTTKFTSHEPTITTLKPLETLETTK